VIDIWNPRLNTKIRIDVPVSDYQALYKIFTRQNIVDLCVEALRPLPEWKNVIEREIDGNRSLQIAWRSGTTLDWIWLDEDVEGRAREWAVLCGLATKQVSLIRVLCLGKVLYV
jgi:hypothetical protein